MSLDSAPMTTVALDFSTSKSSSFDETNQIARGKDSEYEIQSAGYSPHFTAPDCFWSVKFSKKNLRKLFRLIIF